MAEDVCAQQSSTYSAPHTTRFSFGHSIAQRHAIDQIDPTTLLTQLGTSLCMCERSTQSVSISISLAQWPCYVAWAGAVSLKKPIARQVLGSTKEGSSVFSKIYGTCTRLFNLGPKLKITVLHKYKKESFPCASWWLRSERKTTQHHRNG